jgi:hypothetical protein
MPDYHQIVDEIRAFVQATDQTRTPALESLAGAYAQACTEVSRRLSRCQQLLQQGLRTEAIHLAETEPRLLDAISTLDFPERPEWDELVQIYGLPAAAKILMEGASFLNEAYALEDPLQDLLRTHRRLALSRAPVRSRIDVIRKLAAQDSNNPVWTEDLRRFEKARFREIQHEAADAGRRHDVVAIGHLLGELSNQTWVEPPPPFLVQAVRKADAQFRGLRNRAILTDLETQLNDAFGAFDLLRGRLVRDQWLAMVESMGLTANDPVHERVAPPLAWLEKQDLRDEADRRHEQAIRALNKALDNPERIAPAELERLGNAVLCHERGMSESQHSRFLARLLKEQATAERRQQVLIGAAGSAAVLCLCLIGYSIHRHSRLNDATAAAKAVSDMLELGELEQAGDFLKKLSKADADLLDCPAMVEARTRFQAIQDKDVERQSKFEEAFRQAESAPLARKPPAQLQTARSLARLETEKQSIEQLSKRRQEAFQSESARRDDELRPKLSSLSRGITDLQETLEKSKADGKVQQQIREGLVDIRKELAALSAGVELASEDVQSHARVLGRRVDEVADGMEQEQRRISMEAEMSRCLKYSLSQGKAEIREYAGLLQKYVQLSPDSPRGKSFLQVSRESPAWESVSEWNQLVRKWRDEGPCLTAEQAHRRLEACAKFFAENPQFPDVDLVAAYKASLEAIERREFGAESVKRRFEILLSDPMIESIWMVEIKDLRPTSTKYYMTQRPDEGSNLIKYIVGFDGRERRKPIVKALIIYSDRSPQTMIADRFKSRLKQAGALSDWDRIMTELIQAIREDSRIDPLFQVALLRRVTEYAGQGSEPLRKALSEAREILERSNVDVEIPWMDPENQDADRLRPKAKELVRSLTDPSKIREQAIGIADRTETSLARFPRALGWLSKSQESWRIIAGSTPPRAGSLCVIIPQEKNRCAWRPVGVLKDGKIVLSTDAAEAMAEGRPVFLIEHTAGRS